MREKVFLQGAVIREVRHIGRALRVRLPGIAGKSYARSQCAQSVVRRQRIIDIQPSMKRRNSARVRASSRKAPTILLVTMETPRLCTPRVVMH